MAYELSEILRPDSDLLPLPTGVSNSGSLLEGIKAVIFDIYGTLLVSGSGDVGSAVESGTDKAFISAFRKAGFRFRSEAAFSRVRELFFSGIASRHHKMRSSGYPSPEIDIRDIWDDILSDSELNKALPGLRDLDCSLAAAAYEATVNPVSPMPGMEKMIDHFRTEGFLLGIVSNAQFYTPLIFGILRPGGLPSFGFDPELCLFSYTEKRSKPDPFLFNRLSERLAMQGVKPAEAVFIGNDMLNDIMPSAAAGYKTVLFAGDRRSLRLREDHEACKTVIPDAIVNGLDVLKDYIQAG